MKFHIDWFRHSEVNSRDSQTYRRHGDRISLLHFFQNEGIRLEIYFMQRNLWLGERYNYQMASDVNMDETCN
jgi:hypothetical protein